MFTRKPHIVKFRGLWVVWNCNRSSYRYFSELSSAIKDIKVNYENGIERGGCYTG